MSFEDDDFDDDYDFNFTHCTRCPHCKTSMIVIDNKVISCPLCEVMRRGRISTSQKKKAVCQELC